MKQFWSSTVFVVSVLLSSARVMASPAVDKMSDIEVSEYAERMSNVLEQIQSKQLCLSNDKHCVRAEFARNGVSYDDKESVKQRLFIMVGSIQ